ncbi:MAG TPA: hypothetical protein VE954_00625 [Oligoflexus sp.]|uniref:hypothetical protein n=1 Tax=Oligoflexus sp. TaxID=1971216 RepID=UPI002D67E39E|nr:hypothetical protein [Oligoflexus sp.]HYX31583.1 hypothetical protein [Oligoflexus sp.]
MRLVIGLLTLFLGTVAIARPDQLLPTAADPDSSEPNLDKQAFPYIYFDRDQVLLQGIDFDATLRIAEIELEQGGTDSVITIWAIRDQIMSPATAARISDLYFQYIDGPGIQGSTHDFSVWHFAWAIGNIYRLGDDDVKYVMQKAYANALERPKTLGVPFSAILQKQLTDKWIYMGDAHDTGRAYARAHIVIPGNPLYLQSFDDYVAK